MIGIDERVKYIEEIYDGWHIADLIGLGGSARVYKLLKTDPSGREYHSALKVIPLIPQNVCGSRDHNQLLTEMLHMALDEIHIMDVLKGHPNIVDYLDHSSHKLYDNDGSHIGYDLYIRMELLSNLGRMLADESFDASEDNVIRMALDILNALETCHRKHILHRDVKPSNIFLDNAGNYKLGDFGISKILGELDSANTITGTQEYMAPEVIRGEPYRESADIYSVGMMMYRLLNGNYSPFIDETTPIADYEKAHSKRLLGDRLPLPKNAGLEVADIIIKACAYHPQDRYSNAAEIKSDLQRILYSKDKNYPAAVKLFGLLSPPIRKIKQAVYTVVKWTKSAYRSVDRFLTQHRAVAYGIVAALIIALVASMIPANALDAAISPVENESVWEYTVYDGKDVTITGYNGPNTDLILPDEIEGLPVTAIDPYAFAFDKEITSATFGENILHVGESAFYSCESLVSVNFNNNLISIADSSFDSCYSLSDVDLPKSLQHLGRSAFDYCSSIKAITIPKSVTTLSNGVFSKCTSLESISLHDSLVSIEHNAFLDCTSLKSIVLPASLTQLTPSAFEGCINLTEIMCDPESDTFRLIDGVLYDADCSTVYFCRRDRVRDLILPDTVCHIADCAFQNCTQISSVLLPDGLRTIGNKAFSGCSSLSEILLPNTLEQAGSYSFTDCPLASITLPPLITNIPEGAFSGCRLLRSVILPDGLRSIDDHAFFNCDNLTNITLPESLIRIGSSAIPSSIRSIHIPEHTVYIASDAFLYLDSITVDEDNAYYSAVNNTLFNVDVTRLICCLSRINGQYSAPDGVLIIDDGAFLSSNFSDIYLPDSIKFLDEWSFSGYGGNVYIHGNPTIHKDAFGIQPDSKLVIYGSPGSTVELYAKNNGIAFQHLPEQ